MEDHVLHLEQEVAQQDDHHQKRQDTAWYCLEGIVSPEVYRNWLSELVLVLQSLRETVERPCKIAL